MKIVLKNLWLLGIVFYSSVSWGQNHQVIKLWESDSGLLVPESVLYYPSGKVLFVSNIDGEPGAKDKKGSISKMAVDGTIMKLDWADELSAPKGMGIYNQILYVADVDEVVAIDLKTGKVSRRIPIKGAEFLNDISISKKGLVYVSDSKTGNIHRIDKGIVSIFLGKQAGVNGLLAMGDDLYLVRKGELWKADKNRKLRKIASGMDESTDGIEPAGNKNFLVSCWSGVIYYVKADGHKEKILDTRAEKISSADIGYDSKENILYVPTFYGNKVEAYQLKNKK
jgi:DNA-binding beta-propeller fold protein YncE